MRFSVRWLDVCPGEEKRILRKSALWLRPSRKDALCVTARAQNALSREAQPAECAFPLRRPSRMRFPVMPNVQNAFFRRMRFSSPAQTSVRLMEKRILCFPPHEKTHSGGAVSRKGT